MVTKVPLSDNRFALIDDEDAERVLAFRWCASTTKAACRRQGTKAYAMRRRRVGEPDTWGKHFIRLHHFLVGKHPGLHVDHIDGNSLNNQRANLRVVTCAENLRNQGPQAGRKLKGAYPVGKRWVCRFRHEGKILHLGLFDTAEDAARAWDRAAVQHHGEFARLNFVDEVARISAEADARFPSVFADALARVTS